MFTTSGDRAGRRRNIWNPPPAVTVIPDAQVKLLPTVPYPLNIPAAPYGYRVKVYALTYFVNTRNGAYMNLNAAYVDFHAGIPGTISSYLAYGPVDDAASTPPLTAVTDFIGTADLRIYDVVMPIAGMWEGAPGTGGYVQMGLPPTYWLGETDNKRWELGIENSGTGNLTGGGDGNYLRVTAYYSLELMGR